MPTVKTQLFLDTVCADIRRKRVRAAVREELSTHIEEHIATLMQEQGFSEEDAESAALRSMGDPVMLGQLLGRVHSRWKPLILQWFACIFWFAVIAIFLDLLYMLSLYLFQ